MRWLFPLVILVAACPQASEDLAAVGDDMDDKGPPDPGQAPFCIDDADCELASSTCCDCKTFATSANDPKLTACENVNCPPPTKTCSRIRAVCSEEMRCEIACEPQVVTSTCAAGFAQDALGCLIDACAQTQNQCSLDSDCVQTRADCCGCNRGGNDTAVSKTTRASYDSMLGCTGGEVCPEVNTCNPGDAPRCAQGTCKLVAGGLGNDACGRPDLPACPTGTVCVVNANNTADLYGVGVCRTP